MLYISDDFSKGIKELFADDTADDWAMYAPYGYFEAYKLLEEVTVFLTRDDMDNVYICKSEDDSVFEEIGKDVE